MSRSTTAAIELLGSTLGGIVVSDHFSDYNNLPVMQRQLCWAQLIRDLTAIAERPDGSAEFGVKLLGAQAFETTLQQVVGQGVQRDERTPWASTVRICE